MRGFLESGSEGSTVGGGAPFLIYSPRHPHQRLERGQEETEGFSKSPKPRNKVQRFQASQVQECSSGVPPLGSELTGQPPALLWPLLPCSWLCVLFLQPDFCRCTPALCSSARSCDATSRSWPSPCQAQEWSQGLRIGCQGDWLQELAAQHSRRQ